MKNYFKILTTILALMAVFLMPEMGWGQTKDSYSVTYSYSDLGSMMSGSYADASSYWKVPVSSGGNATIAIPITYQPSSDITLTFKLATFGSGNNPTSSSTTITAVGTETSSTWNGSGVSTYPSSSTYVNSVMTLTKPASPTTLSGLNITIGVNTGVRIFRLQELTISYTYTAGGTPTTYTVTFDAGTGTFDGNTDFPSTSNNIAAGTYTLPSATPSSVCASNGWTFAGWATESVSETTTAPTLLTGSYAVSENATLYAVYKLVEGENGGSFEYVFSEQGFTNGEAVSSAVMDQTSGIGWAATEGTNPPKYYDTGSGLRVYNGGTFTITTNDNTISAVSLTFSGTDYTFNSVDSNPTTWSGSQSSNITWNVTRTCRLQKVNVTYGSYTTTYATSPSCASLLSTTVTINSSSITNTDVYTSTAAGSLSASVTETSSGNAVSGATVTWSSSDTDVATIDANGAVTLVGVGTTTITATYAGDTGYSSSSDTYSLTVTNSVPVISANDVSITYNATSFSINYTITNPVTGGYLTVSTTNADWITIGSFTSSPVPFTCVENETASIRTAIVTFTYTYGGNVIATKEVTVTQAADPNAFHNISDITAAGTYKIKGTIVAKSTRGFVVGDGTGYVYYYKGSEPSNNIGDMVKLEGSVIEYGGVFEFDNQTTITSATESNYHTEDPMDIDGTMMDYILTSTETHLSYFVQYKGTLVVNTSKATYYNITDINGASVAEGSISFPINTDFASLDGKNVVVTGYYVGKSSDKYINTMLGSIEENCDGTTVTITSSITNTDVYTSTAAGSLSATVTETESGDPVSGATVTWSSSNTSVATVDASGNVTLVAAGTTTITASYAGVAETYCESSATYELTVINTAPICNSFGTINFGNGNNGTISINSASVTGSDSEGNTWTITTVGTTSFTPNGGYSQVGSGSKPATSITFTTTLPSAVKISDFSAKFGGYGSTAGNVTLKVGETVVGTGSLNGTNDVTIENITEAEGNILTVIVTDIVAGVKCYYISYSSTVVASPIFSLASGGYVGEQYVSIACETAGATIRYTTDGSDPTETSSVYSSAITVGAGVTTLKAKAYYEDCESSIAEATYTICTAAPNAPIISISGDECDNTRTVTITGEGNVTIYYTTDGTDPTTASAVYSSPFNLTSTTTVKAIAVDNDCPSGIAMEICNIMALSGDYEKVTSNLTDWSGEYVIAHSGTGDTRVLSGCSSYGSSTSYGTYHSVSTTSNVLASAAVDTYKVIIEKVGETSTYTIKQGNYYISYTGSGNYLEFYTDTTTHAIGSARWTITWDGSNTVITNVRESGRQIMYNASQPRFACYTGTQQPIDLFKKVQGTATVSVVAGENIKGVWIEDNVEQTTLNTTVCNEVTFHATVAPGYTFLGWYNNTTDELVSTDIDYTHVVKGDIILRAEAELVEMHTVNAVAITPCAPESGPFAVEVDINGGTHGQTASASVAEGSSVTFNATMLDSDHYVFDGWYRWGLVGGHMVFAKASSSLSYTVTITDTITYYAIARNVELWTDVVYEVPDSWTWNGTDETIHITCAEDMAWLISVVNGFNGCTPNDLSGKTVQVDVPVIDMYAHIWVPIGYGSGTGDNKLKFSGTFDGGRCLITGVHIDRRADETLVVETSSHVEYAPGVSDSPYGPMMYAGIFGYTEGATVKNINLFLGDGGLEQCPNDWITCTQNGGYLGSMVAYGKDLDMECCSMLNGVVAYANLNSIGGLVGYATSENPSAHSIKACMANAHIGVDESCSANYFGGLVGYCNYAVKDCFAMPCDLATKYGSGLSGTITYKGAAVGYGTTTSNVYAHPYATANGFTKIDGSETGELLYALTSNYTDATSTFSASEERRYGNYSTNNTIGGRPFADVLNDNVTEGFKWMTPPTKNVNGGYPLIVRESDLSSAVFSAQDPGQYFLGVLNTGLDKIMPIILQITDDEEEEGDKISGKSNNRTDGAGMGVFMYSSGDISFAVPEGVLYIDENVAVTQSVDDDVYATVGVTLDNSTGNGDMDRDWHMFSSAIAAGKVGIEYGSQPAGYPESENDLSFGTDYSLVQNDAAVYFPNGITEANGNDGSEFDLYSFFEPEYHWINLKRTTHWHQDNTNGITYNGSDNANGASFTPGKGYLIALGDNTTKNNNFMQASGVLNNGTLTVNVTNTETSFLKGYNFLGNPYQSYLDFDRFVTYGSNASNLWSSGEGTKAFVVYDADANGFLEYISSGGTGFSQGAQNVTDKYIHPHQGFFVVKNTSGNSTVTFDNSMRCTNVVKFRDEAPTYPLVNLHCTDENGKWEHSVIEFNRPEKAGSLKMKGMLNGKANMYIHWDGEDYRSMFLENTPDYVPVWFEAAEDGVFTMTWNTANADFGYMHLIDNMTGADIDCLTNDSYTFEAHVNDMSARFRLVFSALGIEEETTEQAENFAFINGNELVVTGEGELSFIDLNGRVLTTEYVSGQQSHLMMPNVAEGMYLLRLTKANDVRVQKIVIRK